MENTRPVCELCGKPEGMVIIWGKIYCGGCTIKIDKEMKKKEMDKVTQVVDDLRNTVTG